MSDRTGASQPAAPSDVRHDLGITAGHLVAMYHSSIGDGTSSEAIGRRLHLAIEWYLAEAKVSQAVREEARDLLRLAVFDAASRHHEEMREDFARGFARRLESAKGIVRRRAARCRPFECGIDDPHDATSAPALERGVFWRRSLCCDRKELAILKLRLLGCSCKEICHLTDLGRTTVQGVLTRIRRDGL